MEGIGSQEYTEPKMTPSFRVLMSLSFSLPTKGEEIVLGELRDSREVSLEDVAVNRLGQMSRKRPWRDGKIPQMNMLSLLLLQASSWASAYVSLHRCIFNLSTN